MKGQDSLPYTSEEIMWLTVQVINATEKKDIKEVDVVVAKLKKIADRYEYMSMNFNYGGSNRIKSTIEK